MNKLLVMEAIEEYERERLPRLRKMRDDMYAIGLPEYWVHDPDKVVAKAIPVQATGKRPRRCMYLSRVHKKGHSWKDNHLV